MLSVEPGAEPRELNELLLWQLSKLELGVNTTCTVVTQSSIGQLRHGRVENDRGRLWQGDANGLMSHVPWPSYRLGVLPRPPSSVLAGFSTLGTWKPKPIYERPGHGAFRRALPTLPPLSPLTPTAEGNPSMHGRRL